MRVVLIGQGGHSKVIRDIVLSNKDYEIVGYLDDQYEDIKVIDGLYCGPISAVRGIMGFFHEISFVIAIGSNEVRKRVADKLNLPDRYYLTPVHRTAVVSPSAKVGEGTVIMANAVVNADAQIGKHVIINTGSIVEHDNQLGDFVHISPRAALTGSVVIEEGTHIGAGATVIPNVKIGEWSVIGAGATVIHDLPTHCTAVGTPARVQYKMKREGA